MDKVIRLPEATAAGGAALVAGPATPYLELDLTVVQDRLRQLRHALPGVDVHYAVKCNPHPRIITTLAAAGADFEIASAAELDLLLDLGAARPTVLFSNPVKAPAHIAYAFARGVRYFAADCDDELDKLARFAPGSNVLVRLDVSNDGSVVPLGGKFGASASEAHGLLVEAERRGLRAAGLAFHVGSQALDPEQWRRAVSACGQIMRGLAAVGIELEVLDLGGGLPVPYDGPVPSVAEIGRAVLAGLTTLPYAVRVVVEPGRYLTAEAGTFVATVIGRARRRGEDWLHLDVGAFGGLMEALETRRGLHYPVACTHPHASAPRTIPMAVTGPTCDSEDTVLLAAPVCAQLRTGDVVHIGFAGAYTTAYASTFNGFALPSVITRDQVTASLPAPALVTGTAPVTAPFARPARAALSV